MVGMVVWVMELLPIAVVGGGRAHTCIMRQAGITRSIFFVVDFQK